MAVKADAVRFLKHFRLLADLSGRKIFARAGSIGEVNAVACGIVAIISDEEESGVIPAAA